MVYINDIDYLEAPMPVKTEDAIKSADAKLFWNGRSQAVRLPKEFRFAGDRVRVTRMGAGVLLEPIIEAKKETAEEWFARIDAIKGDPIFPEGRKQKLAPIREYFK
jgi:antitoxin VapB